MFTGVFNFVYEFCREIFQKLKWGIKHFWKHHLLFRTLLFSSIYWAISSLIFSFAFIRQSSYIYLCEIKSLKAKFNCFFLYRYIYNTIHLVKFESSGDCHYFNLFSIPNLLIGIWPREPLLIYVSLRQQ